MTSQVKNWVLETPKMKVEFSMTTENSNQSTMVTALNKDSGSKTSFQIRGSLEEYSSTKGTAVFCPSCNKVRVCEAIDPSGLGKTGDRRRVMLEHRDVQWFRRGRSCRTCFYKFITAEVHEAFLFELVQLRNEVMKGKVLSAEERAQYGDNIIPFPKT